MNQMEGTFFNRNEIPDTMTPTHIQKVLGIGRRQTYEMVANDPPFHVVKVGKLYKISKKAFFKWFDGE
jgi:hypothetical protein